MNERIRELLAEIVKLEDELEQALDAQQEQVVYRIEGTRVRFERRIRETQDQLRIGLLRWAWHASPRNAASAPFIYGMIIPLALLDLFISLYQAICFPLYRVAKVHRSSYIVLDRHHLRYLNSIEKLNCVYCGYANGLLAYAREIASRTEQYWSPIKHARRVLGTHRRYAHFLDYGEARDYPAEL
jgi:hypothetical protein